MKAQLEY